MAFTDYVVVITGAAGGVGRATALQFAESGAHVVVVDHNKELGQETADLVSEHAAGMFVSADLRDVTAIRRVFASVDERFGRVDILVNCAGLANRTPVDEITEDEWDLVNDVNLKASFFTSQEAIRLMRREGRGGRIINIGSYRVSVSDGSHTIYDASKAGVTGLTRSLALATAKDEITVNTVSPGYVITPMTEHNLQRGEWLEWIADRIPLGRTIRPEEIAAAILLLSDPTASAITGTNLKVDGGWSIHE